MEQATIWWWTDDAQIRAVLTEHLTNLGYGILNTASAEEALQAIGGNHA